MNCTRCKKKFTVTSWTKSLKWMAVCPPCIVELCEKAVELDPEEAAKIPKG